MFIYNVTINVDDSVHEPWLEWMQGTHIPDMLQTGFFTKATVCKVLVEEQMGGTTYAIQYLTENKQALESYYSHYADKLRQESLNKFGDKCVAFRTELEIISQH